ncbi:hypothetical protein PoB_004087000 [Plakobranchus ocellatus]|uniref:Uncharacterized protein n=1 Tax=Plakobranchus ocellatus TaxID=259542 RepID=A0AAV4B1A4_9GAST|nr:hypothetical protein PoB_004087000 [Plakobranchus ocellatus]
MSLGCHHRRYGFDLRSGPNNVTAPLDILCTNGVASPLSNWRKKESCKKSNGKQSDMAKCLISVCKKQLDPAPGYTARSIQLVAQ